MSTIQEAINLVSSLIEPKRKELEVLEAVQGILLAAQEGKTLTFDEAKTKVRKSP